ncbi:MAG: calcium/sodium antiporter [Bacteroidia bacterium]|nr:calcium/sodium antiporter [Bacteroidia bacterium]
MILTGVFFVLGFVALIKGADLLVKGASSIAKRLNVSDLVVGLTVVSLGTSAPELVVNVLASINGSSDLAVGNVFGSNIVNVFLIVGVSAIICDLPVKRNTFLSEIPFTLTAAVAVGFLANATLFPGEDALTISRLDGAILIGMFILFVGYIYDLAKNEVQLGPVEKVELLPIPKSLLFLGLGIAGLFFGGKWIVDGAVEGARFLGMSESFIGLTVVAVGTSLPELVTSAVAAYKKNTDIALGNILGSNIFNLLWVLGVSAAIRPLPFNVTNNEDILVIVLSSVLLILALPIGKKKNTIERRDGIILVLAYIGYTVYLVSRG